MKYSISNLLLLTALIAALFGWLYDHRRLSNDGERLNAEASDLFNQLVTVTQGSGRVIWPPGQMPPTRSYNSSIEKDRADWLRDHRSTFYGPVLYDLGKNNSDPAN
jgi:hypothetical protein